MARLSLAEARLADTAIRENRIVACSVEDHPSPALRALYLGQGFRHVTAVPVAGRDRILGVMHLASRRDAPFDPPAIALVQAVGGLVGVAMENAALREVMVAQQDRLRALAEGTARVREEEARRIAHEPRRSRPALASVHIALTNGSRRCLSDRTRCRGSGLLIGWRVMRLSRELRPTILDDLAWGRR
jgi:GAF domain-containing protein